MTDDPRPRPQYGEYATPEEQAKAIKLHRPAPERHEARDDETHHAANHETWSHQTGAAPRVPAPTGFPVASQRRGQANRIVTIVLLALGLINVLGSAPSYLDFPATLQTVYTQVGIGTYTANELAHTLGIIAVVSQSALWIAAALLSSYLLRARRTAWWVPVVGGVISIIVVVVIMYIAMFSDPALAAYLESLR